jgi:hypothetical protein
VRYGRFTPTGAHWQEAICIYCDTFDFACKSNAAAINALV